jgi:hypothetical protein
VIGTVEALGVFLLAILPGFLVLRVYRWGQPPLQLRGPLGELGMTVVASASAWTILYLWRGQELLPVVLGDPERPAGERLDAFAELAGLSIVLGFALGAAWRLAASFGRWWLAHSLRGGAGGAPSAPRHGRIRRWRGSIGARLTWALRNHTLPDAAWDRLLTRLANRGEAVICRVTTRSGSVVFGVLADAGFADWEADGRGLLLDPEVATTETGELSPVPGSRGVFVPGDEIAVLSVVGFPGEQAADTL